MSDLEKSIELPSKTVSSSPRNELCMKVRPVLTSTKLNISNGWEKMSLDTRSSISEQEVGCDVSNKDGDLEIDDSIISNADEHTSSTFKKTIENRENPTLEGVAPECESERHMFENPIIEIGRRLWSSSVDKQHYTKGCLWSPDGTCLLTSVHLDGMHVLELPTDLYEMVAVSSTREVSDLLSAVSVNEGGIVYDYTWYPYMNSSEPESCCWLASRKDEPIHMWDAFNGELRCTYRGYNNVDEVESAISITFSSNGEKIIGGYKKSIKIFDTKTPGRKYETINVKQPISCFALNSGNMDTITTGTWNGSISHYDLRSSMIGALFTLEGHPCGVTWLRYGSSKDYDSMLFSGARKHNKILCWDMRNYKTPVAEFERNVDTNQRIYFDLSPDNDWLISGDTDGLLRIWSLHDESTDIKIQLHKDCCNAAQFHPALPIVATSSGKYHFIEGKENCNASNSTNKESIIAYENSLIMLWVGQLTENPIE